MIDDDHAALHAAGVPHVHSHDHVEIKAGVLDYGAGHAGVAVPGLPQERVVAIEQAVLGHNDALAERNRQAFAADDLLVLNLLSSPGSGKTTLLCETVRAMRGRAPVAVIEGDQQTSFDADRIRAAGAPSVQINTGKGCHLDAAMVARAVETLAPARGSILFVENVGNLVCPAAFDLGEAAKVVILSVTEGEDKPLKYPDMFAAADLLLLNKIDLSPHVDFDEERCLELAHRVNPSLPVLRLSARTGDGMDAWLDWIGARQRERATA
ncbi:hydrogenase nickel incorporation protein HypB [Sphingomonas abietis]|uniref:Hydrogenase maturation factor HypB n=1 Tax=Sphingomonas abietis TaxID=3012344 RepID=A0ABY7NSB6_9SPHN|nr:hydrogenase nickel incorporation protein HypB [Sphingomonas abietis]WBO24398.1 hydrogenase nickel incorporation protein HypB [Sphingomonas abietis]